MATRLGINLPAYSEQESGLLRLRKAEKKRLQPRLQPHTKLRSHSWIFEPSHGVSFAKDRQKNESSVRSGVTKPNAPRFVTSKCMRRRSGETNEFPCDQKAPQRCRRLCLREWSDQHWNGNERTRSERGAGRYCVDGQAPGRAQRTGRERPACVQPGQHADKAPRFAAQQ